MGLSVALLPWGQWEVELQLRINGGTCASGFRGDGRWYCCEGLRRRGSPLCCGRGEIDNSNRERKWRLLCMRGRFSLVLDGKARQGRDGLGGTGT